MAFEKWNFRRPHNCKILEPFAGAGNLFHFVDGDWDGYDLHPNHPAIKKRDTIRNFPMGYSVCITNPPFLAKNSVSRKLGKESVFFEYEDLYLDCLDIMLRNCAYVAAIVPSTFYGTRLFRNRLSYWDKIDYELFSDTYCPVGVAYFTPFVETNTELFVNGSPIRYSETQTNNIALEFNVPHGNYVLNAIDKISGESICIERLSNKFDTNKYLKHTSRNYVLFYCPIDLDIKVVNDRITEWRQETKDFALTSFKSTMNSGKYRKRMSFGILKDILSELYIKEHALPI